MVEYINLQLILRSRDMSNQIRVTPKCLHKNGFCCFETQHKEGCASQMIWGWKNNEGASKTGVVQFIISRFGEPKTFWNIIPYILAESWTFPYPSLDIYEYVDFRPRKQKTKENKHLIISSSPKTSTNDNFWCFGFLGSLKKVPCYLGGTSGSNPGLSSSMGSVKAERTNAGAPKTWNSWYPHH